MVFLLVLLTIVVVILFQLLLENGKGIHAAAPARANAATDTSPGHLFVHDGHTWARLDTSGEAKVGIDHFLMKIIGGADSVSLPASGRSVRQGERVFSILRGGKEIGLVSPIEGVIASVNEKADLNAEAARKEPYKEAWLFTIKPKNLSGSLRNVRSIESASGWFDGEIRRFSSFLVANSPYFAGVGATMQDGGTYPAGIIDQMNEEQVRVFESRFLA